MANYPSAGKGTARKKPFLVTAKEKEGRRKIIKMSLNGVSAETIILTIQWL